MYSIHGTEPRPAYDTHTHIDPRIPSLASPGGSNEASGKVSSIPAATAAVHRKKLAGLTNHIVPLLGTLPPAIAYDGWTDKCIDRPRGLMIVNATAIGSPVGGQFTTLRGQILSGRRSSRRESHQRYQTLSPRLSNGVRARISHSCRIIELPAR